MGHIGWKRGEVVPWAGLLGFRGRLGVGFRVPLAEVARPPKQNRSDCVRLFLPKTGQGRKASSPERAAANESILKVALSRGLRPLPPTPRKRCRRKVAWDAPQSVLKSAWGPVLDSESAVGDLSGPLKVLPRSLPVPPWPLKVLPRSRPVPPCDF